MITQLVTAPALEPLTIAEVREHLRLLHTEHDARLDALITAARTWCEEFTHRALITQTWDGFLPGFPSVIRLPFPPLQSVTAAQFTYVDSNGTPTQVPAADYTVDTADEPGRVYEAYGQTWPTPRAQPKTVSIRFVAGYGTAPTDVPAPLRQAMLLWIESIFDQSGTMPELGLAAERLATPYYVGGMSTVT